MRTTLNIFIFFIFISINLRGQCFEHLDIEELTGFEPSQNQELNEQSCNAINNLPTEFVNDFGIYDFANYIITGADADGVEENIQLAIPKIHKTYYLLISKISDPNGLYLDFRVNLNLPNSGIFACVTDSKKKLLEEKIAIKIREKFASNNNIQMGVNSAIVVGILQFINSVNLLKAGICCDYSKDDILSLMKSNGFMQIPGTAHLLPGGLGITPRSGGIIGVIPYTFSAGGATLNLVSNLNKEINFFASINKNCTGFLSQNSDLCDGKFDLVSDDFKSSTDEIKIWYHIWDDPESSNDILFQKIVDYKIYTELKTLAIFGEEKSAGCEETNRAFACGSFSITDEIAMGLGTGWIIQSTYKTMVPFSKLEYSIPNAGKCDGNFGYADIVNPITGDIWEIKPDVENSIELGLLQVKNYVAKANIYCQPKKWKAGTGFPISVVYNPMFPTNEFIIRNIRPGLVTYKREPRQAPPCDYPAITVPADALRRMMKWYEKHANLSEKELKPAIMHYLAFEDLELAIALNEYVEIIKNNSCYIAAGVAIGAVVVTLICLAPPIAGYLTAAGMTVGVLTMNLRYFVEISDNLY